MDKTAKASKPKPENKAATGAPENKAGNGSSDHAEQKAKLAAYLEEMGDEDLLKSTGQAREAAAMFEAELRKRGLSADNAIRTEAVKSGFDHGETVEMQFTKSGDFNLDSGFKISGREGEICAVSAAEAERGVADGILAEPRAKAEDEAETE